MMTANLDDLPLVVTDVRQVMDEVHREVTELLLEGVQKAAHFCASECAKQVVAARREMYQHFQAQFQLASSPWCPAVASSLPPMRESARTTAPPSAPVAPSQDTTEQPVNAARELVEDHQPDMPTAARSTSTLQMTPQISRTSMSTPGGESYSPETLATSGAYDTYIDTQDAVQSLEDRTRRAARAMDLVEEAIQLAVDAADNMKVDAIDNSFPLSSVDPVGKNVHSTSEKFWWPVDTPLQGAASDTMSPPAGLIFEAAGGATSGVTGDALAMLAKTLSECQPIPLESAELEPMMTSTELF